MALRPNPRPEVISTLKHPAIVRARQALGQIGHIHATHYLLEGHRRAHQALESPAPVEAVFVRAPGTAAEDLALIGAVAARGIPCHLVSRGIFVRIHDLGYETSVTALTLVRRQFATQLPLPVAERDCILVGERIQDPKNVGSLIRTADAWAVAGVILTQDSADPFSRGSVRASTGSILRVPLSLAAHPAECLQKLRQHGVLIIGTSARGSPTCWDANLSGPCAFVMGNESVGLTQQTRALCDSVVRIPMMGGAHSFNVAVAAGILLYEHMRQKNAAGTLPQP